MEALRLEALPMETLIEESLRQLNEFLSTPELAAEIQRGKDEFYARIGAPLPGEPLMEARLASFAEWFAFDRQLEATGRTPVEEHMRARAEELAGERLEIFRGFTRTVHSIFQLQKRNGGGGDLIDLYTRQKYPDVLRVPPTLHPGDLAELRITPAGGNWFATDAFCFHPFSARPTILKLLKEARKTGEPLVPLIEHLMVMNTRYQRYPKTAKDKAYVATLAELSRAD